VKNLNSSVIAAGRILMLAPNDIIRRIERYSGVKLAEAFAIPDLTLPDVGRVS
jgi:hypothetical protein